MANRPAKAGSSREQAPLGGPVPSTPPAATPQAVIPQAAGHRAARAAESEPGVLTWVPYLIALAGVVAGLFMAFTGSRYAARGAGLVGCSLLAAGLVRLVLPPRFAGLLSSRGKTSDVLAFAAFGAGVLAVALMLP